MLPANRERVFGNQLIGIRKRILSASVILNRFIFIAIRTLPP